MPKPAIEDAFLVPADMHLTSTTQTRLFSMLLRINGEVVGSPDEVAMRHITLPETKSKASLGFRASFITPDHSYSFVRIVASRWKKIPDVADTRPVTVLTMDIPLLAEPHDLFSK